jgi:hypothetical protein
LSSVLSVKKKSQIYEAIEQRSKSRRRTFNDKFRKDLPDIPGGTMDRSLLRRDRPGASPFVPEKS